MPIWPKLAKSRDGRARRIEDEQGRYVEFAKRTSRATSRSRGCASWSIAPTAPPTPVAPRALWELGAEVIPIGVDPDGFNINRECGSTAPVELCRKVREMRADSGSRSTVTPTVC